MAVERSRLWFQFRRFNPSFWKLYHLRQEITREETKNWPYFLYFLLMRRNTCRDLRRRCSPHRYWQTFAKRKGVIKQMNGDGGTCVHGFWRLQGKREAGREFHSLEVMWINVFVNITVGTYLIWSRMVVESANCVLIRKHVLEANY